MRELGRPRSFLDLGTSIVGGSVLLSIGGALEGVLDEVFEEDLEEVLERPGDLKSPSLEVFVVA
jgi:hypothetical protein